MQNARMQASRTVRVREYGRTETSAVFRAATGEASVRIDRGVQALIVLRVLVQELGRWVTGRELGTAWPRILKMPLPAETKARWSRAFAHAITDGRVLTRRDGTQQVYAPCECANDLAANLGSDLVRVEIAIARVVVRLAGAVPVEAIEAEIDGDAALTMRTPTSVASRVIRLAEQCRIRRIHAPGSTRGRWYYAPKGSAVGVAGETELVMDRRMRAIRALWRLSDGRPFTTRAVAAYASERDTFVIIDDTVYGWTNALQHLARRRFLTRLDVAGSDWHVRWALSKEWEVLSTAEQTARLTDPYGRDVCDALTASVRTPASRKGVAAPEAVGAVGNSPAHTGEPSACPVLPPSVPHLPGVRIDVSRVSRARDVATLVAMAQARWVARGTLQSDPVLRAHGAERPVTLEEVAEERTAHPLLLPGKQPLLTALHEATRIREEMRAAAVTDVGTVRNTSYFAVRTTAATRAFVAAQGAIADANLPWLQRVLSDLHSDRAYSDGNVIPVPAVLLVARAADVHAEAETIARRLAEALPLAPLTFEERAKADCTLGALHAVAADARAMISIQDSRRETPGMSAGAHRPPENMWLDVAVAEQQFRGLVEYAMTNPRALWARIVNAVRVLREPEAATLPGRRRPARGCGRKVTNYLDRVGFGLWVARRIGGPLVAGMAAQALAMIGESRRVQLLVDALKDSTQKPAHTGLCAALGFFDDDVARNALAVYLEQAVADARISRAHTTVRVGTALGAARVGEPRSTGGGDDAYDASVWRFPPTKGAPFPLSTSTSTNTSGNAVATAVLGLGRTPCGGIATALSARERAALEAVRDYSPIPYARDAAQQVLRGWDGSWTREQWLAI